MQQYIGQVIDDMADANLWLLLSKGLEGVDNEACC